MTLPVENRRLSVRPTCELALEVVDHITAMVAYWDLNQVCRFANNAYWAWFGRTRDEVVGRTMQEVLGPLYALNLPYIEAVLSGETQVFERAIPIPSGTGYRHSIATYIPDIVEGRVQGFFVHVADVTPLKLLQQQLEEANQRAEHLALHDFLTGLPNRRLFEDRLTTAISMSKRNSQVTGLLAIDMDDFKKVNDIYGHHAGDRLLKETASRIRLALRESDTLARIGGDEFVVVAVNVTSQAAAEGLAARILEAGSRPLSCDENTLLPTFSIGIAMCPDHGETSEELMRSADRALYEAKRLGKNHCAVASGKSDGLPQSY